MRSIRALLTKKVKQTLEDPRRRRVLKWGLFGGGAFLLGKIVGPSINLFSGDVRDFENFRVVENGEELGFYDKFGNEILILEKDAKGPK